MKLGANDPAKVVLKWDGPDGGTMFQWDAWYAKLSRLTLDGAGRAGTCLLYGPAFSTYNETSDLVCRDAKHGIVFGTPGSNGQAENEVLRCQFLRFKSITGFPYHCEAAFLFDDLSDYPPHQ